MIYCVAFLVVAYLAYQVLATTLGAITVGGIVLLLGFCVRESLRLTSKK